MRFYIKLTSVTRWYGYDLPSCTPPVPTSDESLQRHGPRRSPSPVRSPELPSRERIPSSTLSTLFSHPVRAPQVPSRERVCSSALATFFSLPVRSSPDRRHASSSPTRRRPRPPTFTQSHRTRHSNVSLPPHARPRHQIKNDRVASRRSLRVDRLIGHDLHQAMATPLRYVISPVRTRARRRSRPPSDTNSRAVTSREPERTLMTLHETA